MKSWFQCISGRKGQFLGYGILLPLGLVAFSQLAESARADSLAYSFESAGNDGFAANGLGVTVSQDTVGATLGTHSLKIAEVGGQTFAGAATGVIDTTTIGNSAIVGNPPGIDHATFDLTLPCNFRPTIPHLPGRRCLASG